jgi:hypothetical protein
MIRLVKCVRDVAPKAVVIVVGCNMFVTNFEQKVNAFNKYLDTHLASVDRTLFRRHSYYSLHIVDFGGQSIISTLQFYAYLLNCPLHVTDL